MVKKVSITRKILETELKMLKDTGCEVTICREC